MEDWYCANCGRKPEGRTCCWYIEHDEEEAHPHPLVPGNPWEAWSADHRFLIALLMERFGGAAEEWELLCRLPWPQWRLVGCVCDPWGRWATAATEYPCLRDKDVRGTRYFLSDMARDAYAAHHQPAAAPGHRERLGTW